MSDNVAAQGEHDRMCPGYVAMPENQCGYCHLIARVREDERANLYTMGQLADRCEESYEEGREEGYARGLIEGDSGGRREGYRIGYDTAWSLSAAEIERQTLDKATEAVAALAPTWSVTFYVSRPSNGEWIGCNGAHEQVDVLAAIAALRGES